MHGGFGALLLRPDALPDADPPLFRACVPIDLSYTVFELISWLQKRFRPSSRPFDTHTMTNTTLEAIAS